MDQNTETLPQDQNGNVVQHGSHDGEEIDQALVDTLRKQIYVINAELEGFKRRDTENNKTIARLREDLEKANEKLDQGEDTDALISMLTAVRAELDESARLKETITAEYQKLHKKMMVDREEIQKRNTETRKLKEELRAFAAKELELTTLNKELQKELEMVSSQLSPSQQSLALQNNETREKMSILRQECHQAKLEKQAYFEEMNELKKINSQLKEDTEDKELEITRVRNEAQSLRDTNLEKSKREHQLRLRVEELEEDLKTARQVSEVKRLEETIVELTQELNKVRHSFHNMREERDKALQAMSGLSPMKSLPAQPSVSFPEESLSAQSQIGTEPSGIVDEKHMPLAKLSELGKDQLLGNLSQARGQITQQSNQLASMVEKLDALTNEHEALKLEYDTMKTEYSNVLNRENINLLKIADLQKELLLSGEKQERLRYEESTNNKKMVKDIIKHENIEEGLKDFSKKLHSENVLLKKEIQMLRSELDEKTDEVVRMTSEMSVLKTKVSTSIQEETAYQCKISQLQRELSLQNDVVTDANILSREVRRLIEENERLAALNKLEGKELSEATTERAKREAVEVELGNSNRIIEQLKEQLTETKHREFEHSCKIKLLAEKLSDYEKENVNRRPTSRVSLSNMPDTDVKSDTVLQTLLIQDNTPVIGAYNPNKKTDDLGLPPIAFKVELKPDNDLPLPRSVQRPVAPPSGPDSEAKKSDGRSSRRGRRTVTPAQSHSPTKSEPVSTDVYAVM